MLQIKGYCSIDENGVWLNNKQLCSSNHSTPAETFSDIYKQQGIQYPKYAKMDLLCKLGFLTSEILMQSQPHIKSDYTDYECSIITSNKSGSLNTDQLYWQSTKQIPSPSLFVCTLPNIVNAEICIRNKFKGENHFFISQEFNAAQLAEYINIVFQSGDTKLCLCGWIEIFNNDYKSCIFAIENTDSGFAEFTPENLNKIFKTKA